MGTLRVRSGRGLDISARPGHGAIAADLSGADKISYSKASSRRIELLLD